MVKERGVSYVEMMVVLVVFGALTAVGVRAMDRMIEHSSARSLITEVLAMTNQARTEAIFRHIHVGIAFVEAPGGVEARVYQDGDGDGVMRDDVRRGMDVPLGPPTTLRMERARVGLPGDVRRDPEGQPLTGSSGVRFGAGSVLSFGAGGTATPGSLYLTCGDGEAWAFRVSPQSARVRLFHWRHGSWSLVEKQ